MSEYFTVQCLFEARQVSFFCFYVFLLGGQNKAPMSRAGKQRKETALTLNLYFQEKVGTNISTKDKAKHKPGHNS